MEQDRQQEEQGRTHGLSFGKSDGRGERVAGGGNGFKRKGTRICRRAPGFGSRRHKLKPGWSPVRMPARRMKAAACCQAAVQKRGAMKKAPDQGGLHRWRYASP
ncbi:hypothetical protein DESPIGER_0712 [Desulfovibrio piger]|uniref:Uncharacterized protein n=1 Tax=Desulfovibrio piger TaxID=901 RepID=A0A1K1LD09_9BACT|nr:hypothetical protein DESPIGER_0712 [Desulfovibrio piger]